MALPRIVWILDQLGLGGAERLALRFASARLPWRIELIGLHGAAPGALERLWGAELEPLAGRIHHVGMRGLDDVGGWWRLRRRLAGWRPLLLHTHLRYATVWGGAAAWWLGCPHVATVHLGPRPETSRRQRLVAACERMSRRHAARVIYVSAAQKQAWGTVAARERAVVVGNGVAQPMAAAPAQAELRRRLGLPVAALVFTTVAMVHAAKGWRTWLPAVEAMARARPGARFVWVGGGEEWELLQGAALCSPAREQIVLPGARSDVAAWLGASDVFLFPSREEAQPTAVMEAMAAGLPVIASRLPAIEEVLAGCGLLVPAGDAAALAEAALAWSEAANPAPAAAAAAARQRAAGALSETRWCERMVQLYEEVLAA